MFIFRIQFPNLTKIKTTWHSCKWGDPLKTDIVIPYTFSFVITIFKIANISSPSPSWILVMCMCVIVMIGNACWASSLLIKCRIDADKLKSWIYIGHIRFKIVLYEGNFFEIEYFIFVFVQIAINHPHSFLWIQAKCVAEEYSSGMYAAWLLVYAKWSNLQLRDHPHHHHLYCKTLPSHWTGEALL